MVGRRSVWFFLLPLPVVACYDRFYGPKLTNAFGFDVLVTVDYDLGPSLSTNWPACRTVFFGSKRRTIQRLVITKDETTLETLTATEARDLAKALEGSSGTSNWMIDSTGVHRSPGDATVICKPNG